MIPTEFINIKERINQFDKKPLQQGNLTSIEELKALESSGQPMSLKDRMAAFQKS